MSISFHFPWLLETVTVTDFYEVFNMWQVAFVVVRTLFLSIRLVRATTIAPYNIKCIIIKATRSPVPT